MAQQIMEAVTDAYLNPPQGTEDDTGNIVLLAFLFSACVEFCQYKFALGYAEVDDVIHNTLGAAIGVFAYNPLSELTDRLFKRKK